MDQSKWAIPRSRGTRTTKTLSALQKPKVKVQGVWVHGTVLKLFVVDPRIPSDSTTILESLGSSIAFIREFAFGIHIQPSLDEVFGINI